MVIKYHAGDYCFDLLLGTDVGVTAAGLVLNGPPYRNLHVFITTVTITLPPNGTKGFVSLIFDIDRVEHPDAGLEIDDANLEE